MLSHAPHLDHTVATAMPCMLMAGPDARRFAQAQFSADAGQLAPGCWQWNAWLDARGRVRALMLLVDAGADRLLAVLRGGDPPEILAALRRYLLRAQVTLVPQQFNGRWGPAHALGRVDAGGAALALGLGDRSLILEAAAGSTAPDADAANAWCLADIRHGWPTLPPGVPPLLPPALGLERLGAVSFDKGCYPGQEIAARLHYRGRHKLGLLRIRGAAPLPAGAVLALGDCGRGYALSCAPFDGGVEALIVAPINTPMTINVLRNTYDVVSRFDA